MSALYASHFSTRQTPQSECIPGKDMTPNSAGGWSFKLDDWQRLDRWLLLGCEGGAFYVGERAMTVDNAQCVLRCLAEDGVRVVRRIVEISEAGRAPKNDPAVFALAMAAGFGHDLKADQPTLCEENAKASRAAATRQAAAAALPRVARTGTMLFAFAEAVEKFRGWGRGLRRAVGRWYTEKEPSKLCYQMVKYQQRNGWSHRDLLRLAHPKVPKGGDHDLAFLWATKGVWGADSPGLLPVSAFEAAKKATTKQEIVRLIREYDLVRECIPTQFLTEPDVWEALLEKMPLTAMVRNLATMTRVGLLAPMSAGTGRVLAELANVERLRKSRLHPVAVLAALLTYRQGHGERGKHTWNPVAQIIDALDGAFYQSFGNVEPTGKRWMLALDVSGSMGMGTIAGVPGLTPRVASAALALVTAAVEPQHMFVAFTAASGQYRYLGQQHTPGLTPLAISPRQRLDDVCRAVSNLPMGGTDCALPMLYAAERRIPVDMFVILTDNESYAGPIHVSQALTQYRQKTGIPAKAICVGMTATEFSVLDNDDAGSLNVAGMDTAVPNLMSQFAAA